MKLCSVNHRVNCWRSAVTVQVSTRNYLFYLRWLPIVFCPRALISKISRWRKLSDSTPKLRAGSRSKMPTNFYNLFIENVAWIGSGFKTFVGWIEEPSFPCLTQKKNIRGRQELQPMKLIPCDLFDRHDHRAGQSKMVYYHTNLQFLALVVE